VTMLKQSEPPVYTTTGKAVSARRIAIASTKGGVGKTTTTINLAMALAAQQQRVLVVDNDPQASATLLYNLLLVPENGKLMLLDPSASMYEVYNRQAEEMQGRVLHVVATISERWRDESGQRVELSVDFAPSHIALANLDLKLGGATERERMLLRALPDEDLQDYDYVLFDCRPDLGLLTINAFAAADYVLIPTIPDVAALAAMTYTVDAISKVQASLNKRLRLLGWLATHWHGQADEQGAVDDYIAMRPQLADYFFANKLWDHASLYKRAQGSLPLNLPSRTMFGYSQAAKVREVQEEYLAVADEVQERVVAFERSRQEARAQRRNY